MRVEPSRVHHHDIEPPPAPKQQKGSSAEGARARFEAEILRPRPARTNLLRHRPAPPAPPPQKKEESGGFFGAIGSFFGGVASVIGEVASRVGSVVSGIAGAVVDTVRGIGQSFAKNSRPDQWLAGAGEAIEGSVMLLAGRAVSSVQTLLFLEPAGERLSPELRNQLRKIFGDSIEFDAVRIKRGFSGIYSANDRPFVHGNTVYMKNDWDMHSIVHEMTHVWQNQHGGPVYMAKALAAQQFGDAYEWEKGLDAGKSFRNLDPEQQAEMIADAFKSGFFSGTEDDGNKRFVATNGKDYTKQLREALNDIRAGRGAP